MTERDNLFISDFMSHPLPKEKKWLNRYFKTRTKRLFLKYFIKFDSTIRFCQHTGEFCTTRYLKKMKRQYLAITERHERAKKEMDFEALAEIEGGKYALKTTKRKETGRTRK
jgi:hypothetical protein